MYIDSICWNKQTLKIDLFQQIQALKWKAEQK